MNVRIDEVRRGVLKTKWKTFFPNDRLALPTPKEYFVGLTNSRNALNFAKIPENDANPEYVTCARPKITSAHVRELLKAGPDNIREGKCAAVVRVSWLGNQNYEGKEIPIIDKLRSSQEKSQDTHEDEEPNNKKIVRAHLHELLQLKTPQKDVVIEFWNPWAVPADGFKSPQDVDGTLIYRLKWKPTSADTVRLLTEDRKDDDPQRSHTLQRMSVYFTPAANSNQ